VAPQDSISDLFTGSSPCDSKSAALISSSALHEAFAASRGAVAFDRSQPAAHHGTPRPQRHKTLHSRKQPGLARPAPPTRHDSVRSCTGAARLPALEHHHRAAPARRAHWRQAGRRTHVETAALTHVAAPPRQVPTPMPLPAAGPLPLAAGPSLSLRLCPQAPQRCTRHRASKPPGTRAPAATGAPVRKADLQAGMISRSHRTHDRKWRCGRLLTGFTLGQRS
jgi:hypothetical protein